MNSMSDEFRDLREQSIQERRANREWEQMKSDRELRRWCIEQVVSLPDIVKIDDIIKEASKIYDWVRIQQKASAA